MSEKKENNFLQIIRGCPFPAFGWFTKENIEGAMDYVPKDDDVIIASYPKTGTTWLQFIVLQIVSKGELFPTFDDVTYKLVPFLEMTGIAAVEAQTSKPRIYKHHIAYNMVQKNDKSKYIYIYRNPEDTVVSFYHFTQNLHPEIKLDFNEFYDNFVTGKLGYGRYFEHVLSFYVHREDDNLLILSYEKLHANRREEILKIAKFLGEEYYQCLMEDEGILGKIIEHTTFEYMKKNLFLTRPDTSPGVSRNSKPTDNSTEVSGDSKPTDNSAEAPRDSKVSDKPTVNFFRKGIVGDGKNMLTEIQRERMKEVAQQILHGTSILDEWYAK